MNDQTVEHGHHMLDDTESRVRALLADPSSTAGFPLQVAGPTAQRQGGGIGIENIRWGLLNLTTSGRTSEYTLTNTTFAELDVVLLRGTLVVTGRRRLKVTLSGTVGNDTANGFTFLGVFLDGVLLNNRHIGFISTVAGAPGWISMATLTDVEEGTRVLSVVAWVSGGTGTVYANNVSGQNVVELIAEEV